jgi:hypothetical protein
MLPSNALTRQEGLSAWRDFLPHVVPYAAARNRVQAGHRNVSRLSASLRFRTLLEDEIIADTLADHSLQETEKWLQEICWRRYWKGWLEMRPQVWTEWRRRVRALRTELPAETLARAEAVMAGESGVVCMDKIARELIDTGYLHNHARMWWASFWIHVEQMPWELGADFFFRHLLDADPASNTLSWRWVTGLQTAGKSYLVRLSNIEKHAPDYLADDGDGNDRLRDEVVSAVTIRETTDLTKITLPHYSSVLAPSAGRRGLWLHPDDLTPEIGPLFELKPVSVAACITDSIYRSTYELSQQRITSLHTVILDGLSRAAAHYGCPASALETADPLQALVAWTKQNDLSEIVALAPFVGPTHDLLPRLKSLMHTMGVRLILLRRPSDETAFSFASAGFFPYWQKMSRHLRTLHSS